jgi:hypothetical protein
MMGAQPSVVVNKKGGFLTAVAQGVFGFLVVAVVCATALGIYGMWLVDKNTVRVLEALGSAENWSQLAPPILTDALSDRRDLDYRGRLQIEAALAPAVNDDGTTTLVLTATNLGRETVTMLTANVVVQDAGGVPIEEFVTHIATPVAFDADCGAAWRCETNGREIQRWRSKRTAAKGRWRGPLLPDNTRRFALGDVVAPANATVTVEVTDVRVWTPPTDEIDAQPAEPVEEI